MYINVLYYNVLHVYVYCIMYDTYVLCIYASPQNIASLNTKAVSCRLTRALVNMPASHEDEKDDSIAVINGYHLVILT
jgi:hypothetical protein